ncbi:unnamed protein product [Amoebophrya sp. A25]|nr:unnamed protein product [Amoebophrya sp. A25]|eukprot:GSA25T00001049001.1
MACCGGGKAPDTSKLDAELAAAKREKDEADKETERIRKEKEAREKELAAERKRLAELEAKKNEKPAPLPTPPPKPDKNSAVTAKQASLQRQKEEILMLAQKMLDQEKELPSIMKLQPPEVSTLYQKYIRNLSGFQQPYFCFALLELVACITFGQMKRCDHVATVWLRVDGAITLVGALLFALYVKICLGPVYNALDGDPRGLGRRLQLMYSGGSEMTTLPTDPASRKAAVTKGFQIFDLFADMAGWRNKKVYVVLSAATGGVSMAIAFGWVPVAFVLTMMAEFPAVLSLFLTSCDPVLDIVMLGFHLLRILFLLDLLIKLWECYGGSDPGFVKDHLREYGANCYFDRMEAGIGTKPMREDVRYAFYPEELKPESYKDIERINVELRNLENELESATKPLLP